MATTDLDDYQARRRAVRERIDQEPPAEEELHIWVDENGYVCSSSGVFFGFFGDPRKPRPS